MTPPVRHTPLNIVHTEASLGWGGQELRILAEAQGMLKRGHQVTILCPAHAQIYVAAIGRGIPTEAVPIEKRNLPGLRAIHKWLATHQVDVINTHSSTDTWLVALAQLFAKRRPLLVRTRHISAPISTDWLTRWLYTSATDHIVTTGDRLRQTLIEHNRFPAGRITSVPTGMDPERFVPGDKALARRALGLPEAELLIGIVATIRSWKGHRYLIDSFSRLEDKSARLLIVGDGPAKGTVLEQIDSLGLAERVIIPGNQEDVLPWLHAMDIFALPSYANEGVPQALIQAMLCEKPIVTTPIGSILDAVEPEYSALVVEPRDSAALYDALKRLMHDHELAKRLGANARAVAVKEFSLESMLDKMEKIFQSGKSASDRMVAG